MCTLSKIKLVFIRYSLLAILTIASVTIKAQVIGVYPTVLPPYSNRLSDYTQKPGKLNVTLQVGALRISPAFFYIEGKISSVDGDIEIYTKPGTKPVGGGISLSSNTVRQLTFNELSTIFNDQTLLYKGITREQILKNGLPEGSYHICFKVFDYTTNQIFSSEEPLGCSNMFSISAIEAPIIISPQNDIEITASTPQNILFQWAQPAGTTPGLNYTLKILELDNPKRNPDDAFKSTGYPVFFETELNSTVYLYTVANPPLTIGKKYAFRVTAHEGSVATRGVGTTYFRNGGNSEVYTFTYTAPETTGVGSEITVSSAGKLILSLPYLSGTEHLKNTMKEADIEELQKQVDVAQNTSDTVIVTDENPLQFSWLWSSGDEHNPILSTTNFTYELSFYKYSNSLTSKTQKTKENLPFYKVNINDPLKGKLLTFKDLHDAGFVFNTPFTFILKAFDPSHKIAGTINGRELLLMSTSVLKTRVVTGNLSYQFNNSGESYPAGYTPVKISLSSAPANFFYATTDRKGFFNVSVKGTIDTLTVFNLGIASPYYKQPTSGFKPAIEADTLKLGKIITSVFSYAATFRVMQKYKDYYVDSLNKYFVSGIEQSVQKPVPGLDAVLYRKTKASKIPNVEGQLNSKGKFTGSLPKGFDPGNFIPIAVAKTTVEITPNSEKITVVKFDHLVCNMQNSDEYFVKVLTNDAVLPNLEASEQKVAFAPKNNYIKGGYGPGQSQVQQTNYQYNDTIFLLSNEPPKSEIKGRLLYRWPNDATRRPLSNMPFEVRLEYDFGTDGVAMSEMIGYDFTFIPANIDNTASGMVVGTGTTDGNGNFTITVINHKRMGLLGNAVATPKNIDQGVDITTPGELGAQAKLEKAMEDLKNVNKFVQGLNEVVTNPTYESMLEEDSYTQQMLNNNDLSGMAFDSKTKLNLNSKSLKVDALQNEKQNSNIPKGPNIDVYDADLLNDDKVKEITGNFNRVFRIRILGSKYFFSPNKDIVVQPFDNIDAGDIDAIVAEAKVKVKVEAKDTKKPLMGIQALIFRNTEDKNIPQGEGNQKGKISKVLSPTFEQSSTYGIGASFLNKEFEWVYNDETNGDGLVTLSRLLGNYTESYTNYTLEICSNPDDNAYFYKAEFRPAYKTVFTGYWNQEKYNKIDWGTTIIDLEPLPSRIAGTVQDAVSKQGIDNALVVLSFKDQNSQNNQSSGNSIIPGFQNVSIPTYLPTDDFGSYEFLNSIPAENLTYNLYFTKSGYLDASLSGTIEKSGTQKVVTTNLSPDATVSGTVKGDDTGNGVPSYVKVDNGKIFETNAQGQFNIIAPSGNNRKVYIIPKDVGYFNDTIVVNISKGYFTTPAIKTTVYKRQHRFRFRVVDEQTGLFIKGAWVTFSHNKILKKATSNNFPYYAEFKFENVSVNAYSVKIEGPAGLNYIAKQINLSNNESKNFILYTIKLKPGKQISGTVKLDGSPVKNAFVYLDKSAMEKPIADSLPEMSARSDKFGKFVIHGIPLATECTELVKATLDTTFTVIGAQMLVEPKDIANVLLNLKKFRKAKIDTFYNIPFSLEELIPLNGDTTKFKVTGLVHLNNCESTFGWIDNIVSSVRVRDVAMSIKHAGNQSAASVDADSVEIDATASLKMRYANKYNVSVRHKSSLGYKYKVNNLVLNRGTDGKGYMNGLVRIVDNSFNFPSTYISFNKVNGEFYFGSIAGRTVKNNIRVMTMQNTVQNAMKTFSTYSISDSRGLPINFSFLGFDAKADPFKSSISSGGDISLSVDVKCSLPNAEPDTFSLHLDGLKLDNNSVKPYAGSNTLKLFLEKWTLEIKNWQVDVKEGGIISSDGIVRTGTVDIPFNHFVLRPDMFFFDGFSTTALQLGGGLILHINDGISPVMVYDKKIGADQAGHWKFELLGTENNPVSTIALPDLDKPLRINYITLISNQANMVGIFQDKFILKNVCYFNPDVFYAGKDAFLLAGGLDLNGPRLNPIAVKLKYRQPSGQAITFEGAEAINYEFEGQGYVKFVANNAIPSFTTDQQGSKFELNGIMTEPNKINDIKAKLVVVGPPGQPPDQRFKVEAENESDLTLSSNKFSLKLKNALSKKKFKGLPFNGMMVSGNDWDILEFTGELFEPNNPGSTLSNSGKKTVLSFKVFGDIQATSDNIQVSKIGSLPGLTLTYLKDEGRLVGNITLTEQPFGPNKVSGVLEFSIGNNGWYIVNSAKVTNIPVINDITAGLLLGSYKNLPDYVIKIATQFSKTVPCKLNESKADFSGFFITGQKSMPLIPNVNLTYNAGVAVFYVKVEMPTIDVSLFTTFKDFSVTMGLGIYAAIHAGMSSILCTNIEGRVDIIGRVSGTYSSGNPALIVTGSLCQSLEVVITQGLQTVIGGCQGDTEIFHKGIGLIINASLDSNWNKSFSFDFTDTDCGVTCF